jgi:integrase
MICAARSIGARKVLDLYDAALRAQGLRPRSVYDYTSRLWPLCDGSGIVTWYDLTADHGAAWLAGEYGEGQELSRPTQVGHLRKWRRFRAWAEAEGYIGPDPLAGLKPGGRRRVGKPHLTESEMRALDAACGAESSDGALAVHLLLWSGGRPKEVLSMRHRDLVLDEQPARWAIPWDPTGRDGTKTEAGVGAVELPAVIATRLAVRMEGKPLDAYVFPAGRQAAGHRGLSWLGDHFHRLCGAAKVTREGADGKPTTIPPYALRGSFGLLLRRRGAPLAQVSDALGHAGRNVTVDAYVGRREEQTASLAEARERLRGGTRVSGTDSGPNGSKGPEDRTGGGGDA